MNVRMIIMVFDISVAFFHGNVRKVIYVVPLKDLQKRGKVWRLLKSLYGTRDASQVSATCVEEGLSDHGLQRNVVVPCFCKSAALETLGVHWADDFIFASWTRFRDVCGVHAQNTVVEYDGVRLDTRSEAHSGNGRSFWVRRQETA